MSCITSLNRISAWGWEHIGEPLQVGRRSLPQLRRCNWKWQVETVGAEDIHQPRSGGGGGSSSSGPELILDKRAQRGKVSDHL